MNSKNLSSALNYVLGNKGVTLEDVTKKFSLDGDDTRVVASTIQNQNVNGVKNPKIQIDNPSLYVNPLQV